MVKRLISFDTNAQDGALPPEVEAYLDGKYLPRTMNHTGTGGPELSNLGDDTH